MDTRHPLKRLVQDFGWIHLSIGLFGNACFFAGSILFLERFESVRDVGVWLFIVGSLFMLVGAVGRLLVSIWEEER